MFEVVVVVVVEFDSVFVPTFWSVELVVSLVYRSLVLKKLTLIESCSSQIPSMHE